jgi:CHAT domain-containing protein/tetratricopeptide (TPR) repeat protein
MKGLNSLLLMGTLSFSSAMGIVLTDMKSPAMATPLASEGRKLLESARVELKKRHYKESIELLNRALITFESSQDSKGKAETLGELCSATWRTGQYQEAKTFCDNSLKLSYQIGDRLTETNCFRELGSISWQLGMYQEANDYYKKSLKTSQEIGDRAGESKTLGNLGGIATGLGKYQESIDYFKRSFKISEEIGDLSTAANALHNIGSTAVILGRYQEAIDYYEKSLKTAQEIGDPILAANASQNLGAVANLLGKYPEALDYCNKSLKIAGGINDLGLKSIALRCLGDAAVNLVEYQEATNYYKGSLVISTKLGNVPTQLSALNGLGIVTQRLGRNQEAIEYYKKYLKMSQEIGSRSGEANALHNLGITNIVLSKYPEAISYYQKSLKIAQDIGELGTQMNALNGLGFINYILGNKSKSIEYLQQSTRINDTLRLNLGDGDKVSLFNLQASSYKLLAIAEMRRGNLSDSLITVERGRARPFAELVSKRIENNLSVLSSSTITLEEIKNQAKSRQATIVSYSGIPDFDKKLIGDIPYKYLVYLVKPNGKITVRELPLPKNLDLKQLVQDNRISLGQSSGRGQRSSNPELILGMLVALKEDPQDKPPGRRIVSIDKSKQEATLKNLENGTIDIVKVEQIAPIRKNVKPHLRQLHKILIEPIADLLPTNERSPVIFIPDGALYEVPFAALQDAQSRYLIDIHTISVAPSLAVLAQTSQLKKRPIDKLASTLVVGNPDFTRQQEYKNLEPLPFSEVEANSVARLLNSNLLLGAAASKEAVLPLLSRARILHFATHGVPDQSKGLNGAIVLTGTASDQGFLRAEEVVKMKLNADLVVLSACDTGLGKITSDGVIGLSRSFIAAGTSSVIVSMWSVNDESTAFLMTAFYQYIGAGQGKSEALRNAMLKTKAKYPNPYFWSGMTLIGEP